MKTLLVTIALVLGATKVSAQFYNPYMPNVSPEMVLSMSNAQLEMMQNAHLAQLRAQTNALHMQTMQMLQARSAAAYNNMTNFQWQPFMQPAPLPPRKEKVTCSKCGGTGKITSQKNSLAWKRERKTTENCPLCHGKGYDRE